MIRRALCAVSISVVGLGLGVAATPAQAAPGPLALTGYEQVTSELFTNSAHDRSIGFAACPAGKKVIGGGVLIAGISLKETMHASRPSADGQNWIVTLNNTSSKDGTYRVYAVCINTVANYVFVQGDSVPNPAGAQTTATVTCPTGTVPLGGGGGGESVRPTVNLNSSLPLSNGWRVDVNNSSAFDDFANASVVCGKQPGGYHQLHGQAKTIQPSSQGSTKRLCTSGTVAFSGGALSNSSALTVNLNSSSPSGDTAWLTFGNNASPNPVTLTTYAVCAVASP